MKIKDICTRFSSGEVINSSEIKQNGLYPVYGGNGIRGYCDYYNFDGKCAVIGRQGAYCGNVRYVEGKAFMTEHAIVAETKACHNAEFFSYFLSMIDLSKFQGQSAQPGLSVKTLGEVDLKMPDLQIQNSIADILHSITSKVHINNGINTTLESMAKILYDYWFLQFDFPDENGKSYKSSGGKMVWNEELKRSIPEGWRVITLDDIATMQTKSETPLEDEYYWHYSIPAYDDSLRPSRESGRDINSNKYVVSPYCILLSKLNPQFKRIWYVGECDRNSICSTEFIPIVSKNKKLPFLHAILNSEAYQKYMIQCSSSSTGSRKRMQPELCMDFKIPYPNEEDIIDKYCNRTENILDFSKKLRNENRELIELREFLLPLLVNGQIGFKGEDE